MAKQKFYVVWNGLETGIFTSWKACEQQVKGVEGAKYKSFDTRAEAERAYASSPYDYIKKVNRSTGQQVNKCHAPEAVLNASALAADAACSGNPGPMEYRGVYIPNGQELFHFGPVHGTNNIGEFLAIVHAMALIRREGWQMAVYSDSRNAIKWVNEGVCKTRLAVDEQTRPLFALIARAEKWLADNPLPNRPPLYKWDTDNWGEIPADFGRK
ncbi:MAG: ribonuclease H family protein [Bacteroidaceae bacterium]|nr:ribonuclease H family protein [Bacteroidaceae bacterium]MBR4778321.1 ribonuclease H family protein [Bacteroidaceae bacterium]